MSSKAEEAMKLNGEEVEEIEDFTYLGSIMTTSGRYRSGDKNQNFNG